MGVACLKADEVPREVKDWMRVRPESVKTVMRIFPPLCQVKAREGERFLVPAPDVTGTVKGYREDGRILVVAPLRAWDLIEAERRFGRKPDAAAGDLCGGYVDADALEVVGYGVDAKGVELTPELVREILDEDEDR